MICIRGGHSKSVRLIAHIRPSSRSRAAASHPSHSALNPLRFWAFSHFFILSHVDEISSSFRLSKYATCYILEQCVDFLGREIKTLKSNLEINFGTALELALPTEKIWLSKTKANCYRTVLVWSVSRSTTPIASLLSTRSLHCSKLIALVINSNRHVCKNSSLKTKMRRWNGENMVMVSNTRIVP